MSKSTITSIRQAPVKNHWADTEPPEAKAAREKAWQEYKCCRDCKHWACDDDETEKTGVGACTLPEWNAACASFICPEDYQCHDFEAGKYNYD